MAQSKLVLAAEDKTDAGATAPSAAAEPASETTPAKTTTETVVGEAEVPTTVGGGASRKLIWVVGGLAVIAAGFAIYKQKV